MNVITQVDVERLIKMSHEQQKSLLRYFSRCPPEIRILILENKIPVFHKLRQENNTVDKGVLDYCSLILAISAQHDDEQSLSKKSYPGMTQEEIRQVSDKKASLFLLSTENKAKQRQKLLSYWADVRTAKLVHGMSFRKIVLFLKKKHRFEVSKSLLHAMWDDIEKIRHKE